MSSATTAILHSLDSWENFRLCLSLYGAHIVVFTCLSAVTIYRREMSCNRIFHEQQDDEEPAPIPASDEAYDVAKECQREELLDQAGLYCSGAPLVAAASVCMHHVVEYLQQQHSDGSSWHDLSPDDLLEKAGHYWTGEPVWAAAALLLLHHRRKQPHSEGPAHEPCRYSPLSKELPSDVQTHIVSYLHPRDVLRLGCVNRSYRQMIEGHDEASRILWKTLFLRDFGWTVLSWPVGRAALTRSNVTHPIPYSKELYFRFGLSYTNYLLAGQNTTDNCLVGLHGNIYDITNFLHIHPGSPETLMVHSGRDSTKFFEDMNHSLRARKRSMSLCVVANPEWTDTSSDLICLAPTIHATTSSSDDQSVSRVIDQDDRLSLGRKDIAKRAKRGTLARIRQLHHQELEKAQDLARKQYEGDTSVLGDVNIYYDPFRQEWRAWYLRDDLSTYFVPEPLSTFSETIKI